MTQLTGKERTVARLLDQAHQLSWDAGRLDVCTGIIAAINKLRRLVPQPLPETDPDQLDCAEEADAQRVTISQLLEGK